MPVPLQTPLRFATWAVTVTEVLRGEAAAGAITAANQFNEPAPEGQEYLLVTLQLENISDKEEAQSPSFALQVRVTGDRNVAYRPASVVAPQPFEGDLFPGGVTQGQVVVAVPQDEGNLLLMLQETFEVDSAPHFLALSEGNTVSVAPELADITPTDLGTRRDAPAAISETVTTEDWEVTVLEVVRGEQAAALAQQGNQFNDPPASGMEYVAVRARVRAIAVERPDRPEQVGDAMFRVTGAQNVVYESVAVVEPAPALEAELFPGGQVEGWAILSAAQGEQELLAIFKPLFSFDDAQTRYIRLE
jgi:hypothetical protein